MQIKELGCLFPYAYGITSVMQNNQDAIEYINTVKGFLCNWQIPLIANIGLHLRGEIAEIGVWYGKTTAALLVLNDKLKLHAIDIFTGSEEHQTELNGKNYKQDYISFIESIRRKDQVNVIEDFSTNAAARFSDNSLSAVFIDAAHDFENAKNDILAWTPKIKSGGMIIFHDYPHPEDPNGGFEDLKKAVNLYVRDSKDFTEFGYFCGIAAAIKV